MTAPNAADCTGGTIQRTSGVGVSLNNTKDVSLTRMRILDSGTDGMTVNNINGFTLSHSYITDSSGSAQVQDRAIEIGDFTSGTAVNGTINITNSTATMSQHDNLAVGIASGTSRWNVTGSNFSFSGGNGGSGCAVTSGNSGINFSLVGNANVTANVTDNSITGNFADGIQFDNAGATGSLVATIRNNSFNDNNIAMDLNALNAGNMTYKVQNNTIENLNRRATSQPNGTSHAVNVFQGTPSSGTLNLRFTGNSIGDAAIPGSGSAIGNCLRVNFNAGSSGTANGVVLIGRAGQHRTVGQRVRSHERLHHRRREPGERLVVESPAR